MKVRLTLREAIPAFVALAAFALLTVLAASVVSRDARSQIIITGGDGGSGGSGGSGPVYATDGGFAASSFDAVTGCYGFEPGSPMEFCVNSPGVSGSQAFIGQVDGGGAEVFGYVAAGAGSPAGFGVFLGTAAGSAGVLQFGMQTWGTDGGTLIVYAYNSADAGTPNGALLFAADAGATFTGPINSALYELDNGPAFNASISDNLGVVTLGTDGGAGALIVAADAGATFTGVVTAPGIVGTLAGLFGGVVISDTAAAKAYFGLLGLGNGSVSVWTPDGGSLLLTPAAGCDVEAIGPLTAVSGINSTKASGVGLQVAANAYVGGQLDAGSIEDIGTLDVKGAVTTHANVTIGGGVGTTFQSNAATNSICAGSCGSSSTLSISSLGIGITSADYLLWSGGGTYSTQCDCSLSACSMASAATTCTCTCTGCTSASICYDQLTGGTATTDAVSPKPACATGTVTITARTAPTAGTNTFNVHCNN